VVVTALLDGHGSGDAARRAWEVVSEGVKGRVGMPTSGSSTAYHGSDVETHCSKVGSLAHAWMPCRQFVEHLVNVASWER
jgi:hypothetical protein